MVESFRGSVILGWSWVEGLSVAFTEPIVPLLKAFLSGLVAKGEVDLQPPNNKIKNRTMTFFIWENIS